MRPTVSNIRKCYLMKKRGQINRVYRHVNKRQKELHLSIALIDFVASNRKSRDRKNMREIYQSVLKRFVNGPPKEMIEKMERELRENPLLGLIRG